MYAIRSYYVILAPGWAALLLLALWSLAQGWFFPALWPRHISLGHWLSADWQPLLTALALEGFGMRIPGA